MKKIVLILLTLVTLCGCKNQTHKVQIDIDPDSKYSYSEEIIIPTKTTIHVSIGDKPFDGLVILKPVGVEPTDSTSRPEMKYITGGVSCKFNVEIGKMYQLGVDVKHVEKVVFKVKNIELAIE